MKHIIILFSLILSISGFAQEDFLPANPTNEYLEYQKQFEEWKTEHTENKKGYKWHMRWLHFTETRTAAYGKTASVKSYLDAATQITQHKNRSNASRATDSTWVPEGPDTLVGAYNSASSHGVARVNTITFHPTDTNTYWVGVSQGGIWKTTDRGQSYFPVNDGLPILRISDIAVDPNHNDTLYASVCDYAYIGVALSTDGRKRNTHYGAGVYKSYDGGLSWSPTGLTYQQNQFDNTLIRRIFVNPANSSEIICAGVDGILKSYDGGQTWTSKHAGLIWDFEQNPLNPNTIYASSGYLFNLGIGEPEIMVSNDFGENWRTIGATLFNANEQMQRVELTISSLDTNYVYAVSCNRDRGLFGFYQSTDAGKTWTKQISETSGPNILEWSGGTGSGGQGTYDLTVYVDKNDKEKVFVGGVNLWGSEDGGKNWEICSYWQRHYGFTPHADQHFLTHNPLDNQYYLCNDGGIFRTDTIKLGSWSDTRNVPNYEFPTTWEDVSSGMQITSLYRVGLCDSVPGYIISGAQDNGTFYRDDKGTWMNITGGDGMDAVIHREDPKQGVSSSQFGRFYRFSNNGSFVFNLNAFGAGSGGWTTPIEQSRNSAGDYFIGFENVIRVSSVSGNQVLGNLPTTSGAAISAFDMSGYNDYNLIVAKRPVFGSNYYTELFYTSNFGQTWSNVTAGLPDSLYCTAVTIDNRDPLLVWAVFGGFEAGQKVYKSADGGLNWTNISLNLPNIPINTIVQDEDSRDNGIYIGCDVGIYYTNDSLSSWELYVKDFPNVIVSDLEIHPKERRLYASTFGRGIWSVGVKDSVFVFPEDTMKEKPGSVSNAFENSTFALFPNPNNGNFEIQVQSVDLIEAELSIVNVMGKRIIEMPTEELIGQTTLRYDLNLPDGVYFLRIDGKGKSKVQRFVVNR